jgi:hypothetical protein
MPLYFNSGENCDPKWFVIDMIHFQKMLNDKGIQYNSIFDLELKDSILTSSTVVSDDCTTMRHIIVTRRDWNDEEKQYLLDFLEEQYVTRMWSFQTGAGRFYVGSPRFVVA